MSNIVSCKENLIEMLQCKARTSVSRAAVSKKPLNRVEAVMACPSSIYGNCSKDKKQWFCEDCQSAIEYGFLDKMCYCNCGRAPFESYTYCCGEKNVHGEEYIAFENKDLQEILQTFCPLKEINVLILGETGVGKSTLINGIVNYMTFETLDEAEAGELVYLIPCAFTHTDANYDEKEIQVGYSENEKCSNNGQTTTQDPFGYAYRNEDTIVRLIDTPGIGDPRGIEQDKENFQKILRYISGLKELHGICILLKPNSARLTIMFEFCITELLTYLHRSAANNIVFCFTNARGTLYRPGDTLSPLRCLIQQLKTKKQLEISLSRDTMYCFDNEAFRFLCARSSGVPFEVDDRENFGKSWDKSAVETRRLLAYISKLSPHKPVETISLNEARHIITNLTKPLAEMSQNIDTNIDILNQKREEIKAYDEKEQDLKSKLYIPQVSLVAKQLGYPRTVCTAAKCTDIQTISGTEAKQTIYKTICHDPCSLKGVTPEQYPNPELQKCAAMGRTFNCKICGCCWDVHMHITYSLHQQSANVIDPTVQDLIDKGASNRQIIQQAVNALSEEISLLSSERQTIIEACAQFGSFLKTNAMATYNDAVDDYIKFLIQKEKNKTAMGEDDKALNSLEEMRRAYKEQVAVLDKALQNNSAGSCLDPEDVMTLKTKLFSLKRKGPELKAILDVAIDSTHNSFSNNETEYCIPKKLPAVGSHSSTGGRN